MLLLCFHFFTLRVERNETMYNGPYFYFPFFVYELGKRERKTNLHFSIFYYGFGKRKTKGRYIQHNVLFRFSFFSSCKRKNENMYNGSYFYFSFFVCGLRKRKRILRYPFHIFYHEIEKRKTKGRYIHGPVALIFSKEDAICLGYMPLAEVNIKMAASQNYTKYIWSKIMNI